VSLSAAGLAGAIENIGFPGSPTEAGQAWGSAYATYAANATFSGAPPVALTGTAALQSILGTGFAAYDASAAAAAFQSGCTAFWIAPPVQFSLPGAAIVTAVGGALAGPLADAWAAARDGRLSRSEAASRIASALDAFTRSVIVTWTHPPTAPSVGPIS
jgi:hypothetical protein